MRVRDRPGPVSELRRKYKQDVDDLRAKVARHEMQETRQWLRDESERLDRDLDDTAARFVRTRIPSATGESYEGESSPQRARARAHARRRIKAALAKRKDQLEALLVEADPLTRGLLPTDVVKRIICKDIGLVADLADVARFLSAYIDTNEGRVDYEAMLRDLGPVRSDDDKSKLYLAMRKAGRVNVRQAVLKSAQGALIGHEAFRQAMQDVLGDANAQRDAMRLFKAMDRSGREEVDVEALLEACFADDGLDWACLTAEMKRCSKTIARLIENEAFDDQSVVPFERLYISLQEDGARLPSREAMQELLQGRRMLTAEKGVRIEALSRSALRRGRVERGAASEHEDHSGSPRKLAKRLYRILQDRFARDSRALFRAIDRDQRGSLCRRDLSQFLSVDARSSNSLFDRFDGNGDGVLDFADLLDVLMYGKLAMSAPASPTPSESSTSSSSSSSSSVSSSSSGSCARRSRGGQRSARPRRRALSSRSRSPGKNRRSRTRSHSRGRERRQEERATTMARIIRKEGWTSAKLRAHFSRFDTRDCGLLSQDQVATALKAFPSTREERTALAAGLDRDNLGSVKIETAVRAIMHPSSVRSQAAEDGVFARLQQEDLRRLLLGIDSWKLRRLFFSHDQDGNGYVSTAQFCNLLENLRVPATRKQLGILVERLAVQLGTPGTVSYADLMRLVLADPGAKEAPRSADHCLASLEGFAKRAEETHVTTKMLLRRCAKLEETTSKKVGRKSAATSSLEACIPLEAFYRVLDAALDLRLGIPCSLDVLGTLIEAFVVRDRGDTFVEYAPALELLIENSADERLRENVLSKLESGGFAHRKAVLQVFRLLDEDGRGVLSNDRFARALDTLGVAAKPSKTDKVADRLVAKFRAKAKRSQRRRGGFVSYLELVHWLYDDESRRSKAKLTHELQISANGRGLEEPLEQPEGETARVNEEVRLLKQELAGLDRGFFDELENLKHSYALTMKRNRELETQLWEKCAESGQPPPLDASLASQIPEASMRKIEHATSSALARRLRADERRRGAEIEAAETDDASSRGLLGDRLRRALCQPRVLETLARELEAEKTAEDEASEDADLFVISATSFRRVLEARLADHLDAGDLDDLVRKFDRDGDGQVRFLEFIDTVRPFAGSKRELFCDTSFPAERTLGEDRWRDASKAKKRAKSSAKPRPSDLLFESDDSSTASSPSSSEPDKYDSGRRKPRRRAALYSSSSDDSTSKRREAADDVFSDSDTEDSGSEVREERLASAREKIRDAIVREAQCEGKLAPDVMDLRAVFDRLDVNRDGKIDRRELQTLLTSSGVDKELSRAEQRSLISALLRRGGDPKGKLRFSDFAALLDALEDDIQKSPQRRAVLQDRLRKDLAGLDLDDEAGHDAVSRREFYRLVDARAVVPLSAAEKDDVMDLVDQDADGLVSQQELNEFAHGKPSSPLRPPQRKRAEMLLTSERVRSLILKLADQGNGRRDLQVAFEAFDKSRSGLVTTRAFATSLHSVGFHLSADEETALMRRLDPHGSGTIDFPSFKRFALHSAHALRQGGAASQVPRKDARKTSGEKLSGEFVETLRRKLAQLRVGPSLSRHLKRFANTHEGAFAPKELGSLLRSINLEASSRQVHQLVNRLDANGTGLVTFAELEAFTNGKSGTTSAKNGRDALLRMAMRKVRGATRNLYKAFQTLAQDQSPYVEQASFEAVLLDSGCKLHEQELEVLYDHSPQNDLGEVQFAEFLLAFVDAPAILRQFHTKNPRARDLLEAMQRYVCRRGNLGGQDSPANGDSKDVMGRRDALRVLRQVGILAPVWQLEAAVDLARAGQTGDQVNLAALCELLTRARPASKSASHATEASETSSASGTVASMVIQLRSAVRASRAAGAEESKVSSLVQLSLQTAVRAHLGVELGAADAEVLEQLLDLGHEGDAGWHWDDFQQRLLANTTVDLALEVDADTDPDALHEAKVTARALHAHLRDLAGPTENVRRAFRALDRGRKGKIRVQDLVAVCAELGHDQVQDNPWVAQGVLFEICRKRSRTFEKAASPTHGIDFGTLQQWVFPVPEPLKPTLESVKRALRDTAKRGGGVLDASRVLRALDLEGTGRVSQHALRKALGKLCPHLRPKDLKKVAGEIFGLISEDGEDIGRAELQRVLTASK